MSVEWKNLVGVYPDFPKPGIEFLDISPVLADYAIWDQIITAMVEESERYIVDTVIGLDARGFLVASAFSHRAYGVPVIMARKPGKLPGDLHTISYDLEYGSNSLSIQRNALKPGTRVGIVDDLLATGGSIEAALALIIAAQCIPTFIGTVIEITALNGRSRFGDVPFWSAMEF